MYYGLGTKAQNPKWSSQALSAQSPRPKSEVVGSSSIETVFSYKGINSRFYNVPNQIPYHTLIRARYQRISEIHYYSKPL